MEYKKGQHNNSLVGKRFGNLKVISKSDNRVYGKVSWDCKCDCGETKTVPTSHLTGGYVKSCGCLKNPSGEDSPTYKHGMKGTPLYKIWQHMKQRCNRKTHRQYDDYGGRGIKVCDRWEGSFENFYEDMADNYKEGLTIERINNNENYTPENCKWATREEQARNKRNNIEIEYDGKTFPTFKEFSEYVGVNYNTLYNRIFRYGWALEKAVKTKRSE